jgi:predicted transposase YdaD
LIETIVVYKFPQLSRQEIEAMLGLVDDVKQTRVYQEGREEGKAQEGRMLILRQLTRRLGTLPPTLSAQVEGLSLVQLEALAEALLDFSSEADLEAWLTANG